MAELTSMEPLDPVWAHCDSIKGLRSTMICRYCHNRIGSGGITGFKYHLAGIPGHGSACESVPKGVKIQMMRLIKGGGPTLNRKKKEKKGKTRGGNVTLAFLKAHVESKKIKRDRVSTKKSETRSNCSHPQSGPAANSRRRIRTRSSRDKKLDTHMFESLLEDLWMKIPEEKKRYCIYFDSLWFCSYQDELRSKNELRKNKILKWIKNKRVFSKKYVFVPIVCWNHWSLLIFCHFGDTNRSPCMLLLDSLLDAGPKRLENDIRRFVSDIYKISGRKEDERFISDIPFLIPKVPQQNNGDECGKCILYFMFRFIESAPDTISLDEYPYFLTKEWFTREEFENFARELELSAKEKKEKGKEQQQISDDVDPPVEVHTSQLIKSSYDSMESQVSSVPSIKSTELKAPQSETLHYIKRRKKTDPTENSSAKKGRKKTNDSEDPNSENRNSDDQPQCNSNGDKETDGVGPTSCEDRQGDAVISKDKTPYSLKQNSSSSAECLTECQDNTSPRRPLASAIEEQSRLSLSPNPNCGGANISPLLKNSSIWQHIQTWEAFKKIPQRPHFTKLESSCDCQEVLEGQAIGLMVTYANLAESVEKLSFDDAIELFEQKISCLDTLEDNGFNVGPLRARLTRLLEIKTDNGNGPKKIELEAQVSEKETANANVLLELDKVELELRDLGKQANSLIEEWSNLLVERDRLLDLTAGLDGEIPKLRDQIANERRFRESAQENFDKLLEEPL